MKDSKGVLAGVHSCAAIRIRGRKFIRVQTMWACSWNDMSRHSSNRAMGLPCGCCSKCGKTKGERFGDGRRKESCRAGYSFSRPHPAGEVFMAWLP